MLNGCLNSIITLRQIVNVAVPHPFLPILAVSGIDDDIKIFHPCAAHSFLSPLPVSSDLSVLYPERRVRLLIPEMTLTLGATSIP